MIDIVDNFARGLPLDYRQCSLLDFARPYHAGEAGKQEMLNRHIPLSLFYQNMIRKLLARYRCTGLDDYLQMREEQDQGEHLSSLFSDAGIATALIEHRVCSNEQNSATHISMKQLAEMTGVKLFSVLSIDSLLEKLMCTHDSLDQALRFLEAALDDELKKCADDGFKVVALKVAPFQFSALEAVTIASARTAYFPSSKETRLAVEKNETTAILRSAAGQYLLTAIFDLAIARKLPVQIDCHAGSAGRAIDSNPLSFQTILQAERFSELKCVFVNPYPFVQEVCHMAAVYPGVFFDLSLTNSLVASDLSRIYYGILSSAPFSKILAGTGGNLQPESHWYGATSMRRGLSEALKELTEKGYMLKAQMEEVERAVLRSNSISLYALS